MTPLIIWILLLGMDTPAPLSTWKISYPPDITLLKSTGESWFIHGSDIYVYDKQGALLDNFKTSFNVQSAFVGPKDTIWLHDGAILACLNDNRGIAWQEEMGVSSCPPVNFREFLAYAENDVLRILDPKDGSARFSSRMGRTITSLAVLDNWIMISDNQGKTEAWEPITEQRELRFENDKNLWFMSRSPLGDVALVYDGGYLEVRRADGKQMWHRSFYIDMPVKPVWLRVGKQYQLVAATHGRNIYAYGAKHGEQLARKLIPFRPRKLFGWSADISLLIADQSASLFWYHGQTRTFTTETLESQILTISENSSYLLIADVNGIIRLYQRDESFSLE